MAHGLVLSQQIEMPLGPVDPALTASQAACMNALCRGASSKSQIAITAGLDLSRTQQVLDSLASLQLAERTAANRWRTTQRGRNCQFETIPDKKRRGRGKLGRAAERALHALDRPMSGSELAARLGITKQRAHQLVVQLHAAGRIRLGDPKQALLIVARADDPTPLLSLHERRLLSALPKHYATTATKIRLSARCSESAAGRALRRLADHGLVARDGKSAAGKVYRLTEAGMAHPQYRPAAGRADPPSLPVRSDRVCAVLSLLADLGRLRITHVRDALGVAQPSINALFQYLKRKSLVRKDGKDLQSPYVLTDHGREVLAEMRRRRTA